MLGYKTLNKTKDIKQDTRKRRKIHTRTEIVDKNLPAIKCILKPGHKDKPYHNYHNKKSASQRHVVLCASCRLRIQARHCRKYFFFHVSQADEPSLAKDADFSVTECSLKKPASKAKAAGTTKKRALCHRCYGKVCIFGKGGLPAQTKKGARTCLFCDVERLNATMQHSKKEVAKRLPKLTPEARAECEQRFVRKEDQEWIRIKA